MTQQEKDITEGLLYRISYYAYGIILSSLYFLLTNFLFLIVSFLAIISINERILPLITVSIMIVISMIPIGPAWMALLYTMSKVMEKGFYSITKNYFHSYKKYFKKSLKLWLSLFFIFVMSCLNYWITLSYDSLNILIYPIFLVIFLTITMGIWVFPLLLESSFSLKQILKLGLYFPIKKVFTTLVLLFILAIGVYLILLLPIIFIWIVPAGYALIVTIIINRIFESYNFDTESLEG